MITRQLTKEEEDVLWYVYNCGTDAVNKMKRYKWKNKEANQDFLDLLNELEYHMHSARILVKEDAII